MYLNRFSVAGDPFTILLGPSAYTLLVHVPANQYNHTKINKTKQFPTKNRDKIIIKFVVNIHFYSNTVHSPGTLRT